MVQGLFIWILTFLAFYWIAGSLRGHYPILDRRFMIIIFFYHSLLAVAYYVYAINNPSDSAFYFEKALTRYYGDNWFDYYGVSTKFIDFISFSLVNHLGFSYESCMVVFSWVGSIGFLFFYVFFRERVRVPTRIFGQNAMWFLFLLPNLHFWSSSLGKGSLIFFGFGLFFYGLNKPTSRLWALILGGWIIFQIRPHIFYVVLVAIAIGYTFSTKGVAIGYRIVTLVIAGFIIAFIYQDILTLTGLEDDSIVDPLISHRAQELTKATSGIDIVNYSFPEKLFAFWFRPLFFDAPGILGYIVSFENLFYLFFFLRLLTPSGISFLITTDSITKTCLLTFLGVSFALAQISGNLGLAMRQKSQVMILMLFVILKYMDGRQLDKIKKMVQRRKLGDNRLKRTGFAAVASHK